MSLDKDDFGSRARAVRTERAERARQLRAQGLSLRAIAGKFGVDVSTVAADLSATAGADMNDWLRGEAARKRARATDAAGALDQGARTEHHRQDLERRLASLPKPEETT